MFCYKLLFVYLFTLESKVLHQQIVSSLFINVDAIWDPESGDVDDDVLVVGVLHVTKGNEIHVYALIKVSTT